MTDSNNTNDLLKAMDLGNPKHPRRESALAKVRQQPLEEKVAFIREIVRVDLSWILRVVGDANKQGIRAIRKMLTPLNWLPTLKVFLDEAEGKGVQLMNDAQGYFLADVICVALEVIESDQVSLIEELFKHAELNRLLSNVLSSPTEDVGQRLFLATCDVTADPTVCAHLVYAFSDALKDTVAKPDVSNAYYEGFTHSEKLAVCIPKTGVKYESGYSWSPVPMLKAITKLKQLELTRFYTNYRQRLMYKATTEWKEEQECIYDRELQKWVNLEAGKFCPETMYTYEAKS
ncbi:hypothetical protein ACFL5Z_19175 [Planctomycetota bacterium]